MKMRKVQSAHEIVLQGIRVELETVDGAIKSLVLTDGDGRVLKVGQDYFNALLVLVPAPPEFQTKYRVSSKYAGYDLVPIECGSETEAEERATSLRAFGAEATIDPFTVAVEA